MELQPQPYRLTAYDLGRPRHRLRFGEAALKNRTSHLPGRGGVKRAFLWMFIRSSGNHCSFNNLSFPGHDRMHKLLKAHS